MFTVYKVDTETKVVTIKRRTSAIAYRVAEATCDAKPDLAFDDTCEHDTAYAICRTCREG